jgi:hypothetical protein
MSINLSYRLFRRRSPQETRCATSRPLAVACSPNLVHHDNFVAHVCNLSPSHRPPQPSLDRGPVQRRARRAFLRVDGGVTMAHVCNLSALAPPSAAFPRSRRPARSSASRSPAVTPIGAWRRAWAAARVTRSRPASTAQRSPARLISQRPSPSPITGCRRIGSHSSILRRTTRRRLSLRDALRRDHAVRRDPGAELRPVKDSTLASAGGELRLANGLTPLAKFDGEFPSRSNTYAGTGTESPRGAAYSHEIQYPVVGTWGQSLR